MSSTAISPLEAETSFTSDYSTAMSLDARSNPSARQEEEFRRLSLAWEQETRNLSSMDAIVAHPAYRSIIAMGAPIVPIILRALQRAPSHWFPALVAITGEDPVPAPQRGRVRAMAAAWLDWGRRRGYL